jgi:hypothetical protein
MRMKNRRKVEKEKAVKRPVLVCVSRYSNQICDIASMSAGMFQRVEVHRAAH